MLAEFGLWWWERMGELGRPAQEPRAADTLLLRPDGDAIEIGRRRRGRVRPLGRFAPGAAARQRRGRERVTLVAGVALLRCPLTLPLAAERGLATLVQYEMDRLTPFAAAEVVWACRMLRRDRAKGSLQAELLLLPKARIAAALQALADAGLTASHVEASLPGGALQVLPLVPPDPGIMQRAAWRVRAAGGLCAALAAACVALPVARQWQALDRIEAEIATLRPAVAEAQALQRRLAGAGAEDALTDGRGRAADALATLAALTEALPDDTYLTQLTLQQRRITLEGQTTGAASRLIAAVAAESRLRDPAFTAPVVRGDAGNEIFSLQAELAR